MAFFERKLHFQRVLSAGRLFLFSDHRTYIFSSHFFLSSERGMGAFPSFFEKGGFLFPLPGTAVFLSLSVSPTT